MNRLDQIGSTRLRLWQGIPYMFNSPSLMFDLSGRFVTATLPGWGTGMARRMSFGGRLQNAISPRALSVFLTPAFISVNKVRASRLVIDERRRCDVGRFLMSRVKARSVSLSVGTYGRVIVERYGTMELPGQLPEHEPFES